MGYMICSSDQRIFSYKTSELRTMDMVGVHAIMSPHHHVNPVIMSTTLYCKPHHYQVVGKCDSSEEAQSAVFLGGNVAPEVAEVEVGLCFRACGPRSGKVVDKTRTGL